MATVVPWHITLGRRAVAGQRRRHRAATASAGSAGVDGTFAIEPSAATTSVNVPPVSTPIRETSTTRGMRMTVTSSVARGRGGTTNCARFGGGWRRRSEGPLTRSHGSDRPRTLRRVPQVEDTEDER